MYEIPELPSKLFRRGAKIGSGLDKECFEVYYRPTGELLPYVWKQQHKHGRVDGGQTDIEILYFNKLLAEDSKTTRAAIANMAYIICTTQYRGAEVIIQERVQVGVYGDPDHGSPKRRMSPCNALLDAGYGNSGIRSGSSRWVACDWGIESYGALLSMGHNAISQKLEVA